ncbi:MAG: hypothetical protein M1830_010220 [Pleopsidium flavum]|nr:MAG: hypothetical protein M1830_010220 [Pleopsidium flavum]
MASPYPSFTSIYHHKSYPAIDPTRPELSAQGRVVLISGGSRGIGAAIASAYARAGAKDIIITGRNKAGLEASKAQAESLSKSRVHIFVADVLDQKATDEMFASIKKDIGMIDVLVSNAAYLANLSTVKDASIDDFWTGFEVNVKGTTILTQAFLKSASEDAVLIDINAGMAHTSHGGPFASYAASKIAVTRVLDFVRMENPKLRVYSIHPGVIKTDMTVKARIRDVIWDDVELSANFTVWLASHEADFLSGRFLWANWDVEQLKEKKSELVADPSLLTYKLGGWPFGQ